ncbi:MAG: hypothetical protein MK172_08700 [Verrucomicrobiales bacterium]|nr:hypothetical protein [Verrucomicrobiales bacterium]
MITLTIVAVIVLINQVKKSGEGSGGDQTDSLQWIRDAISQSNQHPTYSDLQYRNWADQLEMAMQDAGTDEDAIYRIMGSMANDMDVLKLMLAFGVRGYNGSIVWTPGFLQSKLTLSGFFQQELSDDEIIDINEILQGKGITTLF